MTLVNIHQAKTHFSKLIERVRGGEEIVIGKAGQPVARLVPYIPERARRTGGQWKGRVRIAEDFDSLPKEVAAAFRGERE